MQVELHFILRIGEFNDDVILIRYSFILIVCLYFYRNVEVSHFVTPVVKQVGKKRQFA